MPFTSVEAIEKITQWSNMCSIMNIWLALRVFCDDRIRFMQTLYIIFFYGMSCTIENFMKIRIAYDTRALVRCSYVCSHGVLFVCVRFNSVYVGSSHSYCSISSAPLFIIRFSWFYLIFQFDLLFGRRFFRLVLLIVFSIFASKTFCLLAKKNTNKIQMHEIKTKELN